MMKRSRRRKNVRKIIAADLASNPILCYDGDVEMKMITQEIAAEIEKIVSRGNVAEVVKLKHEIIVFERTSKKRISTPVEFRE